MPLWLVLVGRVFFLLTFETRVFPPEVGQGAAAGCRELGSQSQGDSELAGEGGTTGILAVRAARAARAASAPDVSATLSLGEHA